MNITIKPVEIQDNPSNMVTSDEIFLPRKPRDKNGNYLFHPDGIFSERIFGKFNHCKCGKLTKPGYCKDCECRVINAKKMPNFYIEFDFDVPKKDAAFTGKDKKKLLGLLKYKGFMYQGEYIEFSPVKKKKAEIEQWFTQFNEDDILLGKEAILSLGISEEEYESKICRKITIPHTSYRQITISGDQYILGNLNKTYLNIIKEKIKYDENKDCNKFSKLFELNLKYKISDNMDKLYDELFQILAENHRNVVDNELKGQPETGMIRAVMTNNFSLDEDNLLIGYYFIPALYPTLYEKYTGEDGLTDVEGINEELAKEEYLVLFNRQPTIGAKSIIAMHPIFSILDDEKYVIQANPIIYEGLAADVDGDALNVIALYTKESCEEAKKLLPSKNYIEGSNSSIRNGLPEDFEYVKIRLNS